MGIFDISITFMDVEADSLDDAVEKIRLFLEDQPHNWELEGVFDLNDE